MLLALGYLRHAVRRASRLRVRRSVRPPRARRCTHLHDPAGLERKRHHGSPPRPQPGRIEVLRRLPAQAAAQERRSSSRSPAGRGTDAGPDVHRVHGGLQHFLHGSLLRAGNGHHTDPAGRHARLRALSAGDRRSRADPRPHRFLQLRRSVPAQARDRHVRVHQAAITRTSISTRAPMASRSRKRRRGGWFIRGSTR